jgi:hypothetical protein
VLGINWWSSFDFPLREDRAFGGPVYWIGRGGDWGRVRGGHAICAKPRFLTDSTPWWDFYDQGQEGACVGFAASRMMSLLNRARYDARWLYREAQRIDEWPGESYEGTSVRAGLDVLRERGHRRVFRGASRPEDVGAGVSANRWARSVDDVLACLGDPNAGFVILLNSWGRSFPHYVRLPVEALDRLLREDGEATVIVDR